MLLATVKPQRRLRQVSGRPLKLAQGLDNLLVVGRCMSADHRAHHATKEIPACFATGEAAGTATALAQQHWVEPAAVAVSSLQSSLQKAGVYLGQG